jgi:hypothetical protein
MSQAKPQLNPPGKETIYVDVEDEITSIIDKVEASKSKIVVLMLPKRASTLQSVVNMRLLKRGADSANKNIILVTSESALLPLAGAAGIHVAKDLKSAPEIPASPVDEAEDEPPITADQDEPAAKPAKLDYHRSIGELAAAHDDPETIALDEEDELPLPKATKTAAEKASSKQKLKVPNFERFRLLMLGGIAALVGLIIFIFLAIFVLPKAVVAIQTASTPISANLTLNASDKFTALNKAANQIPASLKATKQSSNQQVSATGTQNQGNKASGKVTLTNCTDNDVTISAGTGVTSGGLTFITQSNLSLNSGNFTSSHVCKTSGDHVGTVNVIAQSGGTKYNIGPSNFSVAGFSGVNGSSSATMIGGTDNNVTVVSQQDIDNARTKATSGQTGDDITQKFLKQLDDQGFYALKSTLKTEDPVINATPSVGQPASTVNVSVQITYSVLVVPKTDLRELITDTLNEQIDASKQKISSSDVLKDASVTVQSQTGPAAATLNVSETTAAVPIIDVATVKKQVAGQKSGNIKAMINNWPGVKSTDVKFSPFWVSKAPKKQNKITVKLIPVKE